MYYVYIFLKILVRIVQYIEMIHMKNIEYVILKNYRSE